MGGGGKKLDAVLKGYYFMTIVITFQDCDTAEVNYLKMFSK